MKKFGYMTVGGGRGGSATSSSEIWLRIIWGQAAGNLLASGNHGVRRVAAEMERLTTWINPYGTDIIHNGLGRCFIFVDGLQVFTANADEFVVGNTYSIDQQVSYNEIGYKCVEAGTATAWNTGAKFSIDKSITKKPKQVLLCLDNRSMFNYAMANGEWVRAGVKIDISNEETPPTNPMTGLPEIQKAYSARIF